MKDTQIISQKIANDIHLKNIFVNESYLELGIIDVKIIQRLLNYEIININDITCFQVQNKGLGHSNLHDDNLRNYIPYYFFMRLVETNFSCSLCITYGLLQYLNEDKHEAFMPIFLLPIKMYYENGDILVQMISHPVENPMLYSVFSNNTKLLFLQTAIFSEIHDLDFSLASIDRLPNVCVKLDNYLTYFLSKENDIIMSHKSLYGNRNGNIKIPKKIYEIENDIFYTHVLNYNQRLALARVMNGNDLTITGFSGTGKTTVLKNIIINNLGLNKKTLYISNSTDTLNDMNNFLVACNLGKYTFNSSFSFPKLLSLNYEDVFNVVIDETAILRNKLLEYYKEIDLYENHINDMIRNFRFSEIVWEYYNLSKQKIESEDKNIENNIDDVKDIYKHEYYAIHEVLVNIEESFKKIKSFKDSVWRQIPIINNIKHVNQVINIVFQLYNGLKKLRESEIDLGKYGINGIMSFSGMKKIIMPLDKMIYNVIPDSWKKSVSEFEKAKGMYQSLKNDIYTFQEKEYYLSTKYKNLSTIDIKEEINKLFGTYYTKEDLNIITELLINKIEITRIMYLTSQDIKDYNYYSIEISSRLRFNFIDKDASIKKLEEFFDLLSHNHINSKMMTIVMNNRLDVEITNLTNLKNNINLINDEIVKMKKSNPKLSNLKKGNILYESDEYRTYDTKLKKIDRLSREYQEICGNEYIEHQKNISALRALKEFYSEIKTMNYKKVFVDFLQELNDTKYYEIISLLMGFINSYKNILKVVEKFTKYKISFNALTINQKVLKLNDYFSYLRELYDSNKRLYSIILSSDHEYIIPEQYYQLSKSLDDYNAIVHNLQNNLEYKERFAHLYMNEETDVLNVMKIIQMYESYKDVFVNEEDLYNSFERSLDLKTTVNVIVELISEIGENLRLYSLLFKDSVSRYYFSNIESNIGYLDKLLNSKDELKIYLNITQGIGVLNSYRMSNLINYIEEADNVNNLSIIFGRKYFNELIEDFLKSRMELIDTKHYIEVLEKTITTEDIICKQKANLFLNEVIKEYPIEVKKIKVKNYDYEKYFDNKSIRKRLKVFLCDRNFANHYNKYIEYDTVIIDDAHMLTSGEYSNLLKGKQTIICGDYQSNKIVNQNLISLVTTSETITLHTRYETGPWRLTENLMLTSSPNLPKYEDNLGVRVIEKNIEDYIYNIYMNDSNVRINYFIKDINNQKAAYELIAKAFIKKNISSYDITYFLNNNIVISDINLRNYIPCDYNILYLKDYCFEDSQIVASNLFEILVLAKKEILIYDSESILLKNIDYDFFKRIKKIICQDKYFCIESSDRLTESLIKEINERGYNTYTSGNGINFLVESKTTHELVVVIILYSGGQLYETLNKYRDIHEQYISKGQKVVIHSMLDLITDPNKFITVLCEDIDGK